MLYPAELRALCLEFSTIRALAGVDRGVKRKPSPSKNMLFFLEKQVLFRVLHAEGAIGAGKATMGSMLWHELENSELRAGLVSCGFSRRPSNCGGVYTSKLLDRCKEQ